MDQPMFLLFDAHQVLNQGSEDFSQHSLLYRIKPRLQLSGSSSSLSLSAGEDVETEVQKNCSKRYL